MVNKNDKIVNTCITQYSVNISDKADNSYIELQHSCQDQTYTEIFSQVVLSYVFIHMPDPVLSYTAIDRLAS